MTVESVNQLPSDQEFYLFQQLILQRLGIFLPLQKKALLTNRLWKRLRECDLTTYEDYYNFIVGKKGEAELHLAMELITTNETYFFREQKHFDYLEQSILPNFKSGKKLRVWSAAASTGEEPYSIAMLLADKCQTEWELECSDVNKTVIEQARRAIYPNARIQNIPRNYLHRFCRKGIGPQDGFVRVTQDLRDKVNFFTLNLNQSFPDLGKFDLVFLRNVLIYFENDTKAKVLDRIANMLNPNGVLFVGHSESLHGVTQRFAPIKPAIYRLV
ncbi:MAG: methyltransferase domain-containing protein [Gammaproteobacteria bacterium]|nr:MAG: methyltransferase domain-containing protein [Gammaproteobacteria bacterium]